MIIDLINGALATYPGATITNTNVTNLLRTGFLGSIAQEVTINVTIQPSSSQGWVSASNLCMRHMMAVLPSGKSTASETIPIAGGNHAVEFHFAHVVYDEVVGTIRRTSAVTIDPTTGILPSILPDGWDFEHECDEGTVNLLRRISVWFYPSPEIETRIRSLGLNTHPESITIPKE